MKRLDHPPLWRNWSGTVRCEPNHRAEPVTLEEIQAEVVRATDEGERLRVIGSGASFSPLCACDDNHLSLRRFSGIASVDVQRSRDRKGEVEGKGVAVRAYRGGRRAIKNKTR